MERALVLLLVITTVSGCGVPSYQPDTSRVVNGEEARPYSWPWQVSLEFHTYRVVLAEHDMKTEEGPEQSIMVAKMFIHPKWNRNCVSCGNDIALLKLEKSAVINDKVQPACLPQHGATLAHNQPCYVTGWGRLYSGGPSATTLQQALLPVLSKDNHVGGGESKSACHGDSGGPLNCKGRDGKWYVQGVTSFVDGRGCNTPQKPTIFTRVASFIPWISETMAQN
ncbi:hypothetical protein JOQ06_001637 [Pogonophryne albipinna]|uniref:Peptidase S1 domain-containing protein n=1 Tax=Pogonophryne albipinna TaxID=1090488 RepID=A0AAD6B562_9TELE|nr:hypothetical protein JOQ06_001637 [Pogonophryne albipinna]